MHQGVGDTTNSYYPQQFHQSAVQNPNPNTIVDPYVNSWPSASASAPPLSSSYAPPPDYPNYSPAYPPYPQNSNHVAHSAPTAPSFPPNPNFQFSPSSNYHYDHNQTAPNPNLTPNSWFSGPQYSSPPSYADSRGNFDSWGGYGEQEHGNYSSQGYSDDGVYRYEGGKVEPYGARGTAGFSGSFSQVIFDDYGRPINLSLGNDSGNKYGSNQGEVKAVPKVVKAIPKEDVEEDVKGGVQKFRVKVLAEGYGQSDMDVLCQV